MSKDPALLGGLIFPKNHDTGQLRSDWKEVGRFAPYPLAGDAEQEGCRKEAGDVNKRQWLLMVIVGVALVVSNAVLAQGTSDTSPSGDVWDVAGQFRDISFIGFLVGCVFMLWRQLWAVQQQLTEVLQRQADWNRAVTPVTPEFRAQSRELSRYGERPKTPPFGTDVPVSTSSPPS